MICPVLLGIGRARTSWRFHVHTAPLWPSVCMWKAGCSVTSGKGTASGEGMNGPWLDKARFQPLGAGLVMLITGHQHILRTRHLTQLSCQPRSILHFPSHTSRNGGQSGCVTDPESQGQYVDELGFRRHLPTTTCYLQQTARAGSESSHRTQISVTLAEQEPTQKPLRRTET